MKWRQIVFLPKEPEPSFSDLPKISQPGNEKQSQSLPDSRTNRLKHYMSGICVISPLLTETSEATQAMSDCYCMLTPCREI